MEKIEIRNRWSDTVIYTHEAEGATMRDAALAAVAADANLRSANLRGANLSSANLRSANLRSANLSSADLSGANLRDANLSSADLSGANLRDANLSSADLRGANLRGANLSDADLTPVRDDIWSVLSAAPREVAALIDALKAGRVDGSTYSGECSCLVGTIATARGTNVDNLELVKPNSSRPAERFFMGIRKGDTPETNQFSALALQWSQQWLNSMQAAFGEHPQQI